MFGNISRSAEVPSFGESVSPNFLSPTLPNIPFRLDQARKPPQRTKSELPGMKRPDYAWEIALYHADIPATNCNVFSSSARSAIAMSPTPTARSIKGLKPVQEPPFSATSSVGGAAPDKIWLNFAYTLNDFHFDNDPKFGNNILPGAPRHYLRAELLYKHRWGSISANLEWVPQAYFADSANTLITSAYAIWGFKVGFDNGGPLTGYIEARNIANKAYIASASIINQATPTSPLFEPGNGRAVYAGVRYRW